MTYIPVDQILERIPNKFEAIKVAALECRRLNDKLQALEIHENEKVATLAVRRLIEGKIRYYDARERREQERSEAMLAAAEEMLDMTAPSRETLAGLGVEENPSEEAEAAGTGGPASAASPDAGAATEKSPGKDSVEGAGATGSEATPEDSGDEPAEAEAVDADPGGADAEEETPRPEAPEGAASAMNAGSEAATPDAPEETKD